MTPESQIPKKYTVPEFAARIRARYPSKQYDAMSDDELTMRMLKKHPVYKQRVDLGSAEAAEAQVSKLKTQFDAARNAYMSAAGRTLNPDVTPGTDYFRPLTTTEKAAQKRGEPVIISEAAPEPRPAAPLMPVAAPQARTRPRKTGVLEQGNIDLTKRPRVKNPDGTISTVRSISVNIDGREVLLPTVSDDGRILTKAQAINQYRQTGKHLGVFDSPASATAYAQKLHQEQAKTLQPPVSLAPVIQGRLEQIQKQKRQQELQSKVEQARQVRQRAQGLLLPRGQRNLGAAYEPKFGRGQTYREVPKLDTSIPDLTKVATERPLTFAEDQAVRVATQKQMDRLRGRMGAGADFGGEEYQNFLRLNRTFDSAKMREDFLTLKAKQQVEQHGSIYGALMAEDLETARQERVAKMGTGEKLQQVPKSLVGGLTGGVGTSLKGLAVATKKIADTVMDTGGLETKDTYTYRLGEAITELGKDNALFKSNPDLEKEFFVGKAPDVIGQSAIFLLGGWASQSPKLVISILGGTMTAGDAYDEVKAMGGSEDEAVRAGLIAGAVLGPTELLGTQGLVNALKGTVAETSLKAALKTALREGRRDVIENALQEIGQEAGQGLITGNPRTLAELAEAGILGGIGGLQTVPTSLAASGLEARARRAEAPSIVDTYLAASPLSTPEEKAAVEKSSTEPIAEAPTVTPEVEIKEPVSSSPQVEQTQALPENLSKLRQNITEIITTPEQVSALVQKPVERAEKPSVSAPTIEKPPQIHPDQIAEERTPAQEPISLVNTAKEIGRARDYGNKQHPTARVFASSPLQQQVVDALPLGSKLYNPIHPDTPEMQSGAFKLRAPNGDIWEVDLAYEHAKDANWKIIGSRMDGFAVRNTGERVPAEVTPTKPAVPAPAELKTQPSATESQLTTPKEVTDEVGAEGPSRNQAATPKVEAQTRTPRASRGDTGVEVQNRSIPETVSIPSESAGGNRSGPPVSQIARPSYAEPNIKTAEVAFSADRSPNQLYRGMETEAELREILNTGSIQSSSERAKRLGKQADEGQTFFSDRPNVATSYIQDEGYLLEVDRSQVLEKREHGAGEISTKSATPISAIKRILRIGRDTDGPFAEDVTHEFLGRTSSSTPQRLSDWSTRLKSIAQSKDLNALQVLSDEMAAHKDDPRVAKLRTAIQDQLARARQPEIPERPSESERTPTEPQKLSQKATKLRAQAESAEGKTVRPAPAHRIGAPKLDSSRNSLEQQVRAYGGVKDDVSAAYAGEIKWLKESSKRGTVNQTGGLGVEDLATRLAQDGYGKDVWWEGSPNNVDPQKFLQALMDDARGSTKHYSTERDVIEDDPDVKAWDSLNESDTGKELVSRVESGRATAQDIIALTREADANGLSPDALSAFVASVQRTIKEELSGRTESAETETGGYTLDEDGTLLDPDGSPLFARQLGLIEQGLGRQEAPQQKTEDQRERLRREQQERDEAADPLRAAALRTLAELKRRGLSVDEYARQGALFGPGPSADEISLLKEVERGQTAPAIEQGRMFARGEEQRPDLAAVTNTEAFKKWFRNSKVVDKNGDPKIVYHRSPFKFTAFDPREIIHFGFHFGTKKQAQAVDVGEGRGHMYPVYLRVENPLRLPDLGSWDTDRIVEELAQRRLITAEQDEALDTAFDPEADLRQIIQSHGYDGIVYENQGERELVDKKQDVYADSYIVFEPTQIKSATGNRGTFDPNDPSILAASGWTEADTGTTRPVFAVEGNRIALNNQGANLLSDAYRRSGQLEKKAQNIRGTYDKNAERLATTLDAMASEGAEGAAEFADAVRRAGKSGQGKITLFYGEGARKHELFHEASSKSNRYLRDRHGNLDSLTENDTFSHMYRRLTAMGYDKFNMPALVEEAAAHIAEGRYEQLGITRAEAVEWMYRWFKSFEAKNPNINPREFQELADEAAKARDRAYTEAAQRQQVADKTIPSVQTEREGRDRESIAAARSSITDNEAFKRWFKNSKVVDRSGDPRVVYHYSPSTFTEFDPNRILDFGFHFGSKDQAASMPRQKKKGGPIYDVYLSIQNPLRLPDLDTWRPREIVEELRRRDLIDSSEEFLVSDSRDPHRELREILQARGYDGIVYRNDVEGRRRGGDSYIAFEPTQIKSATGNRGTFDPNDPNILMARSEDAEAERKTVTTLDGRVKDTEGFSDWLSELLEGDQSEIDQAMRDDDLRRSYVEDYLGEQFSIRVREDGLIDFWQLGEQELEIIDDLPVVVYHHTSDKLLKRFKKEGLVSGKRIANPFNSQAGVYVTTDTSGPAVEGYRRRAVSAHGGNPVTVEIKVDARLLTPDPDDADIVSGKTQWVLPSVAPTDIVGITRGSETSPLFARSEDPWADLIELSDEFGRLANEPELAPGEKETKPSKLAAGVEARAIEAKLTTGFQGLPEYETVKVADQARMAAELLSNDPQQAKRVALGQAVPSEAKLLPESVFVAVEQDALRRGDVDLLRDLATSSTLSMEATGMGQRIRMLGERDPYSPVTAIKEIQTVREKRAKQKMGTKAKEKIITEIKTEVRKAAPKAKDWKAFLNEIRCK